MNLPNKFLFFDSEITKSSFYFHSEIYQIDKIFFILIVKLPNKVFI